MFVRSTVIDADRVRVDDGITFVRDRVAPLVAGLDGALGLTMLVNRATGQTETSTLWGTRAAMAGSDRLLTSVREEAGALMGGRPRPRSGRWPSSTACAGHGRDSRTGRPGSSSTPVTPRSSSTSTARPRCPRCRCSTGSPAPDCSSTWTPAAASRWSRSSTGPRWRRAAYRGGDPAYVGGEGERAGHRGRRGRDGAGRAAPARPGLIAPALPTRILARRPRRTCGAVPAGFASFVVRPRERRRPLHA